MGAVLAGATVGVAVLLGASLVEPGARGQADCGSWQACRDLVVDALASEQYERALDLAWRAVQLGPRDDAALMFLLARAQARAGRPQDALVMVRRLAERRIATEALDHPDLARTRELAGWPDVEPLVRVANASPADLAVEPAGAPAPAAPLGSRNRGSAPATGRPAAVPVARGSPPSEDGTPSSPVPSATPPSAEPGHSRVGAGRTGAVVVERPAAIEEVLRFAVQPFVAAGVVHDTVSHRFIFGDRHGRKLRVVGEGLDEAVDLVRAEAAGFFDVRALDIDTRRGDLWVASADAGGGRAWLHRIQLVSGRPIQTLAIPGGAAAAIDPVDVAVVPGGDVYVLDARGRVWRTAAGSATVTEVLGAGVAGATSLAFGRAGAVTYVSHAGGILVADTATGRAAPLASPPEISLAGIERLRAHRGELVGLQADADGTRRIVRLSLDASSRAVSIATVFDTRFPASEGPIGFAVSGDDVWVTTGLEPAPGRPSVSGGAPPAVPAVRRLRLP